MEYTSLLTAVANNYYGTTLAAVQEVAKSGRKCILDIEMEVSVDNGLSECWRQGVKNVKKSLSNARFLFIKPPSMEELGRRLRTRQTDSEEAIQKRLETAKKEIEYADTGAHDKIIINDELDKAFQELERFILED